MSRAAGSPAIGRDVLRLGRDSQGGEVGAGETAELPRRKAPRHRQVREIGQRMPERREFPVEDGENSRLGRMEDHVVEAKVAVHDRRLVVRGNVGGQPADEGDPLPQCARRPPNRIASTSARSGARCNGRACRSPRAPPRDSRPGGALRARGSARRNGPRARRGSFPGVWGPTRRVPRRTPSRRTASR